MGQTFANILLPLPLQGTFTYLVPEDMKDRVKPGHRVIVPFGRKKFYTGLVMSLTPIEPKEYTVKPVAEALDRAPVLRYPQLKLWEWIADYYLCTVGEVYNAAVPAGLKVESETWLEINPDYEEDTDNRLSQREALVIQALDHSKRGMSVAEIEKTLKLNNVSHTATRLLERGAVIVSEKLVERYRSKKVACVALTGTPGDDDWARRAFDSVKSAKKQEMALLAMMDLSGYVHGHAREVTRAALIERAGVSPAIVKVLETKGIVRQYNKEINRFAPSAAVVGDLPTLSIAQKRAMNEVHASWIDHDVSLLHGVTSSGKTEIYIHLIDYVLKQGRQVLFLVPEIALTTQLTGRLQRVFGDKVVIYHSKFTDNERVDIWRKMLADGEPKVVLGPRSAVFLPYRNIGLVIVDEEHEPSYKQVDPAPRYNGRDTALMLARMHGAKSLLGSATPTIETYWKASTGRYGLVNLAERYGDVNLPAIQLIDMSLARKRKEVADPFSLITRDIVAEAVATKHQAIVFLNRRGFAPMVMCSQCGFVPRCETCDVSLTYHKGIDRLVCHYCGMKYPLPTVCPACGEPSLEIKGFGTERIEDEVAAQFPDVPLARLDLDTTRNKDGYENIIGDFSRGKTKILIGTQMVTKGLDFAGVSAVAVVNADTMINLPDFRATERAFNMIEQVAGRAGRRNIPGVVAVQTYNPSHPIFDYLIAHNYNGFYNEQIEQRRHYNYPPFTRIIYIYIKHPDVHEVDDIATEYGRRLRALLGTRVNGPEAPYVSRVQSQHIRRLMLKIEVEASMSRVKALLRNLYVEMHSVKAAMKRATIYYDVDPV
ncbi:MAG: primosomal protein N' [Muribaculaceae bacterium]|nr:primosomal protein N' [Muribaculaceae bacterium]